MFCAARSEGAHGERIPEAHDLDARVGDSYTSAELVVELTDADHPTGHGDRHRYLFLAY